MCQKLKTDGVPILSWAPPSEIEPEALAQLRKIASLPVVVHHVAVMPDVHVGRGATVGSVIPMRDAVAPAAVGVDIGCGMLAVRTSVTASELPDGLRPLRELLEAAVPTHTGPPKRPEKRIPVRVEAARREILGRLSTVRAKGRSLEARATLQLGTLGGGNHFLELCLDETDHLWIQLHSGSRNLGALLAEHHMERAERARPKGRSGDPELAFFLAGTPPFDDYLHDLSLAQDYADVNREVMLARTLGALLARFPRLLVLETVSCRHNYVARETHFGEELYLTRKGAIAVPEGRLGLIPGSMGSSSFVVRGRGSPDAFDSASHGAGRRMSRGQARQSYTTRDLEEQTRGVECRKDRGVIDEAPKAYKKIERVMEHQKDLVEIVHQLRPILCVKG